MYSAAVANERMSDVPEIPGGLSGLLGVAVGGIVAGVVWLRQHLSSSAVDRAADSANVETIANLRSMFEAERKRADDLMREREALITNIGDLKGQVLLLTDQVKHLTNEVKHLRQRDEIKTAQGEGN